MFDYFDHPELKQKRGLELEWPGTTSWLPRLSPKELLRLKVGELVWVLKENGKLECVQITHASHRLHAKTLPSLNGIQVFFTGSTIIGSPHLYLDGNQITMFEITDLEAAYIWQHRTTEIDENVVDLKEAKGA